MLCALFLDTVDWSRQIHMFGKATDTPRHLRALLGSDSTAIGNALNHLDNAPLHHGTITPAAVTCAQFIVAALDEGAIPLASTIDGVVEWLRLLGSFIDYAASEEGAHVDARLLEQFYQLDEKEAEEFLESDGCELMDGLLTRSLLDLHAYAPSVVATLKRCGASQATYADWEKYAGSQG